MENYNEINKYKFKYQKYKLKNEKLSNILDNSAFQTGGKKNNKNKNTNINNNLLDKSFYNKIFQKYGDFSKIGNKYKTDKVTHHNYTIYYPQYLEVYRKLSDKAMLEIGIDHYRSLGLWLDYFPKAYIYGIDIGLEETGDRYEVFKCDQSDNVQLDNIKQKILANNKDIFFIIDDGSHLPEHQILTFNNYFETLLIGGGCYIIEDIETSYWTKNDIYGYSTRYGYHSQNSLIEIFKLIIDDINREFLTTENKNIQDNKLSDIIPLRIRKLIKTITFGKNCIIIMKKDKLEIEKTYRFIENL